MHNLCSHWEVLEIRNGALYLRYENEDDTTSEPLLVVPRCLVNDVLTSLHEVAREHLKTAQKRQKRYHDSRGTGNGFVIGDPDRELPLIKERKPPFQRQRRATGPPAWMDDFEVDIN